MGSEKKRPLEDAVEDGSQVTKKIKSDPESADADAAALKAEKKRLKKEKREKEGKEKKDKKEKKSKKEKKEKEVRTKSTDQIESTADPTTEAAAVKTEEGPDSIEEKPKKSKKEKKEEKDKKGKKERKDESSRAEAKAEPETEPEANGASNPSESTPDAPVTSGTYTQSAALTAVPSSEIQSFLTTQHITLSDPRSSDPLRPILSFDQLPPSALLSKAPFASFSAPTPIQSASWPFALAGRDVIGIAETGSGKTIAFALPCVEKLSRSTNKSAADKRDKTVYARAVVVSPTRELAMQTHAAIAQLAGLVGLRAVCLYGGSSKDDQRALLRQNRGADIVVATPGRLKDFLAEGCVSLGKAEFAVLDEADRMLDKGFEEDVKLILGSCPAREQRQTLMFTATWPASVRGLAEGYMVDPVKVTIGRKTNATEGEEGSGVIELQANIRIEQKVEVVDPRGKEQRVLSLLKEAQQGQGKSDRILVFCLYKKEAERVERFLQQRGIKVCAIHGDLSQERRTQSLEAFKKGTTTVLVATDVAARGLDIPEVKLVINVTFPLTIEDYVHRIGRTGRAGKTGKAITLFTEHDKAHSGSLINVLKSAGQPVPDELMKFGTTVKKKAHDTYGAFFKDVDMSKKGTKITFD